MSHEEKVMFLLKLAVDTANARYIAASQPNKMMQGTFNFDESIEVFYKKFESLLDKKLQSST